MLEDVWDHQVNVGPISQTVGQRRTGIFSQHLVSLNRDGSVWVVVGLIK